MLRRRNEIPVLLYIVYCTIINLSLKRKKEKEQKKLYFTIRTKTSHKTPS